jgi:hypothetical protein
MYSEPFIQLKSFIFFEIFCQLVASLFALNFCWNDEKKLNFDGTDDLDLLVGFDPVMTNPVMSPGSETQCGS